MLGAAVAQHIDLVAVNSCGSGQQVMLQVLLRHIFQIAGVVDDGGIPGIVLDQAQDIGGVDVADVDGLDLGDDNLDVVLQQGVAGIGADFGDGVGVILQALDDDLVLAFIGVNGHCQGKNRDKVGGIGLVLNMVGHIVDALVCIQLSLDEVVVGVIMYDELDVLEVTLAVREQLGQLNAVGVYVGIVYQGVIVAGVGTLPGQNDLVEVANVTTDQSVVGIHGSLIGNAQGAVGVAGEQGVSIRVDTVVGVDLFQTSLGHGDGHDSLTYPGLGVGDGEQTIRLIPGIQQVGTGGIGEELDDHILLVVGQTVVQSIDEGVLRQVGALGRDGRQGRNNLIVDHITGRSGAGVGIAVGDVIGGTVVLAGVVLVLAQGLFKGGDASQVLGVNGNIVDPAGAAVGGVGAVHGGHGDGNEEGATGGGDHLRNHGLNDQIQTQLQILGLGLAVGIGQGHGSAAVGSDVALQSVLDAGGVGLQGQSQGIDQDIRLVEILVLIQLVGIGVTLVAALQAQGIQQVGPDGLVDAVQHLHMVVGDTVLLGLGELHDIGDLQVGELDTLDSVAVAGLAVAQVGLGVIIAGPDSLAQGLVDVLVIHAGGDIGGVPDTVLLGVGQIVLVQGHGALGGLVDGGVGHVGGEGGGDAGENHNDREAHGQKLLQVLHIGNTVLSKCEVCRLADRLPYG